MIDTIHDLPRADGMIPVMVAGEPEAAQGARRSHDGIPIPAALDEQLRGICERCAVPYLLQGQAGRCPAAMATRHYP
jgi:LDH2 family malate/lactate/ureidoglycolate dehydrogenase